MPPDSFVLGMRGVARCAARVGARLSVKLETGKVGESCPKMHKTVTSVCIRMPTSRLS